MNNYYVLVDYDNFAKNVGISQGRISNGVLEIIRRLDQKSDFFSQAVALKNITVLLYGGWFFYDQKSYLSTDIYTEISDDFPQLYTTTSKIKININCEMSYGIFSLGKKDFYATYRMNSAKFSIKRKYPKCCEDGDICVDFVEEWLKQHKCIYCDTPNDMLFYSVGQKMVDSMIFCDLHYLSQQPDNVIAIVSSDDDMLPVIFQESVLNEKIYHVLTLDQHGHFFTQYYTHLQPKNYKSITW